MELIEKLQKIIEREIDNVPMVLTDPLTLRRLRAERLAQAALTALIEHAGGDGVTEAQQIDREAATHSPLFPCPACFGEDDLMQCNICDDKGIVADPEAFARHGLAAEERGARMALEAAVKVAEAYDGKPCGPAQLWTDEQREFFDCGQLDASRSISDAIRQIDPAALGAE